LGAFFAAEPQKTGLSAPIFLPAGGGQKVFPLLSLAHRLPEASVNKTRKSAVCYPYKAGNYIPRHEQNYSKTRTGFGIALSNLIGKITLAFQY
jgi:hypothetical protein